MEKVWTHAHALVVDKSVWCQSSFPLRTEAPGRWGRKMESQVNDGELPCGALRLVCEVCRDSTWAQHIQTFMRMANLRLSPPPRALVTWRLAQLDSVFYFTAAVLRVPMTSP